MRTRDKKRIVKMFLSGMSVPLITTKLWPHFRRDGISLGWSDVEQVIRDAFEVEKERRRER